MDGLGGQLALVAVLVLVNALFAGSEVALISLREGQLERLRSSSRAGRVLVDLTRDPNRYLSTIQVAITLAGFLASATAAVTLAQPLVEPLVFLGDAARPVAIFLVTLVLTFVTLVLGELAPKRLAMQRSEQWALVVARPLSVLTTLATPVVWVLSRSTDVVVRLFGGDPDLGREEITPDEVRDLVRGGDLYEGLEGRVIAAAMEIGDRTLRQVVTPRTEVFGLTRGTPVEEALDRLATAGHSRAPVWTDDLDDAEHYVAVLSLIGRQGVVGDHAEPAVVLPESLGVLDALWRLQQERRQIALVISEHGAVEGIVTVEDLVEEVVGEIHDEHDPDLAGVVRHDDESLDLSGRFPLHDLPDLGLDVPDSQQTTVAGLVAERLGRVPRTGDRVRHAGLVLEVRSMSRRTARTVRVHPPGGDAADGHDGPGSRAERSG